MSDFGRRFPIQRPAAYGYDAAYEGVPNWDIGRPQRAFVEVAEAGLVRGPVLDVGCGTGELSLFLARQGHEVLGIDLAPRAIQQARQKAHWRRIPAEFVVWDALDLRELADRGFSFRTVVDCATFHVFTDEQRERYVEGLAQVLESGGALFLVGDARSDPARSYGIAPTEIRDRFGPKAGWRVAFVRPTTFERRYSANAAYLAAVVRQ